MIHAQRGTRLKVFAGPKVPGLNGIVRYVAGRYGLTVELLESGGPGYEKGSTIRVDRTQISHPTAVTTYETEKEEKEGPK